MSADQPAAQDRIREIVDAAKPGLTGRPRDCTDHCGDGLCDCSGEWRVLAWDIDVPALREALDAAK